MTSVLICDAKSKRMITVEKIEKTDAEWKKLLTQKQYEITTRKRQEKSGNFTFNRGGKPGVFRCVRCGTDLFHSSAQFESRDGCPSFYEPVSAVNVTLQTDYSLGLLRTEVMCRRCDSHLGHVFHDGPKPTGKRFCINRSSLRFVPETEL